MDQVARVILALEAPEVAEEVMHVLDRSGRARVVATAGDDRQLAEAVRQLEPDVVVAEPGLLSGARACGVVLAIDVRERCRLGGKGALFFDKARHDVLQLPESFRNAQLAPPEIKKAFRSGTPACWLFGLRASG